MDDVTEDARAEGGDPGSTALLLTGRPGVGKTTAVVRAARRLSDLRLRGFVTEETRDDSGRRTGFEIVTLEGERSTLAHVDIPAPPRVSRYGVDVDAVDAVTASELEPAVEAGKSAAASRVSGLDGKPGAASRKPAVDAFLVDEIGKMECFSARFVAAVRQLLESGRPLVATVARRGGGLIREVKEHPASELWEVTPENRDEMPGRVEAWLRERVVKAGG